MTLKQIVLITGAIALVVAGGLLLARIPVGLIILFVALVVVGGGIASAIVDPEEPALPERVSHLRGGARREVTFVAWSMRARRGRVAPTAAARLHAVAARRLARMGIDLDDPRDRSRAEDALGASALRVVMAPAIQSIGTLRSAIRAVDRLGDPEPAPPVTVPPGYGKNAKRSTG